MEETTKGKFISLPVYQQIAADVASRIVEGRYRVGEKIYTRSAIASQYGVSAETARRAICILADLEIVRAEKGSGVTICSNENATRFIQQFHDTQTVNDVKQQVLDNLERQRVELDALGNGVKLLVEKADRFRAINPFVPFQIEVRADTPHLNKTIHELNFWQHTTATIIAIKRDGNILLSPGPYGVICENDVVYMIGGEESRKWVHHFMYPPDECPDAESCVKTS